EFLHAQGLRALDARVLDQDLGLVRIVIYAGKNEEVAVEIKGHRRQWGSLQSPLIDSGFACLEPQLFRCQQNLSNTEELSRLRILVGELLRICRNAMKPRQHDQ